MDKDTSYFFIRLYEYNDKVEDYTIFGMKNRILLNETVIKATNREQAKLIAKQMFGDFPFNLTKKLKINGMKYFFITDSNLYWYNEFHAEVDIICPMCGEHKKVVGLRNVYQIYSETEAENKITVCSLKCKNEYFNQKQLAFNKKWVNLDDHLLVGSADVAKNLMGYIYKITNKHTGNCYIGQTKDSPVFRWYAHLKEDNHKFERDSIVDLCFEVLEVVLSPANLSEREQYYIDLYGSLEYGYNLRNEAVKIGGEDD